MLKEYKRYNTFRRVLIDSLYALREINSGYVATYTSNNKLVYICVSEGLFVLYLHNKIYYACPLDSIDFLCFEISKIFVKYGTNQILSTSF